MEEKVYCGYVGEPRQSLGTFGRVHSGHGPESCEERGQGKGEGREWNQVQPPGVPKSRQKSQVGLYKEPEAA